MPRRISPSQQPAKDVLARIIALVDGAVERLSLLVSQPDQALDGTLVHEVRKRGKEARALAPLLGRANGVRARRFDESVRDAGRAISALRDAQALAGTFDSLAAATSARTRDAVTAVQAAAQSSAHVPSIGDDTGLALEHLVEARAELVRWKPVGGFDPIAEGIEHAYRSGRRRLAALRDASDDEHLHDWRKAVKRLWYQTQAIRDLAPSVLGPMVDVLDRLSELLGDDHDLAVLVARLTDDPEAFGGGDAVAITAQAARARQTELRDDAVRLGATVFAEPPAAFRRRVEAYWTSACELGPEP